VLFSPPSKQPPLKRNHKPVPPTPEQIGRIAADRAVALAPKPHMKLAPSRVALTGLPSYFWLRPKPHAIVARAQAGALVVVAQARPVQYVWNFGDGRSLTTTRPGRRWTKKRRGNVSHLYETRGRYTLRARIIWEARWRTLGGRWAHLGYFSTSSSRGYGVRQVLAVLTKTN
jgi:hypothetical protein